MKQGLFRISPGKISVTYDRAIKKSSNPAVMPQIMKRRSGVFTKDRKISRLIANRLGWVDIATTMKRRVATIERFAEGVFKDGLTDIVLMGMGGSSLCPEVFARVFKKHPKVRTFVVLDSTDPKAVQAAFRKIQPKKTLCIVASKSGGTVETRSQEAYFMDRLIEYGVKKVGRHFVAITDEGSKLQAFARRHRYRKTFVNPSDIGGRYSALSYFGLVPGFFAGVDLVRLLDNAVAMQEVLADRKDESNPGLALGTFMAMAEKAGRNKLTFLGSRRCAPFVPWVEQLVAESTGKRKKGVVPVEAEPDLRWKDFGSDRSFVLMRMAGEKNSHHDSIIAAARKAIVPVVEIVLKDKYDLGGQLLLWEAATAIAGYHMRINPFDEPNVTESKLNTNKLLDKYCKTGALPELTPVGTYGRLTVLATGKERPYRTADLKTLPMLLKRYMTGGRPPRYMSLLGYFKSDSGTEREFARLRALISSRRKMATTRGYGPRFLHSIGQLFKGGPADGFFVVFVEKKRPAVDIPGSPYGFGTLIGAQALGDAQALIKRKLPTLVVAIDGKPADGLASFSRALSSALK